MSAVPYQFDMARVFCLVRIRMVGLRDSLLCGPISPVVNLEMSSTVRFYDGNAIYGCSGLGNCRMLNFLSGAFFLTLSRHLYDLNIGKI